jgi:hypothetical protein
MDDATQLRTGVALLALGAVVLFAPLVFDLAYTTLLLAAAGSVLVGLSQRGRSV